MKKYIFLIIICCLFLPITVMAYDPLKDENKKEFKEMACAFGAVTDEFGVMIRQYKDGKKELYVRNPSAITGNNTQSIWQGGGINYDEIWGDDFKKEWVKASEYVFYEDYRTSDELRNELDINNYDVFNSEIFHKLEGSKFDLEDYCGDNREVDYYLFRFYDGNPNKYGNTYSASPSYCGGDPVATYKDPSSPKIFIFTTESVLTARSCPDYKCGDQTVTSDLVCGFQHQHFIDNKYKSDDDWQDIEGELDDVINPIRYDGNYEEYKKTIATTSWKLYCYYGVGGQYFLNMYISDNQLLLLNPHSDKLYPISMFDFDDIKNLTSCPSKLYFEQTKIDDENHYTYYLNETDNYFNAIDLMRNGSGYVPEGNIDIEENSCESILGSPKTEYSPAWYLKIVFNVIKYIAIIILIILTIMDFVGAITSQDNDQIKKVTQKAIIRLILCIVIFVLPTLIEFILQFLHDEKISICIMEGGN